MRSAARRWPLEPPRQCLSPLSDSPRFQALRALHWFAARTAVSAQRPSTDATATAIVATVSIAMVMACIEVTGTTAVIVAGRDFLPQAKPGGIYADGLFLCPVTVGTVGRKSSATSLSVLSMMKY